MSSADQAVTEALRLRAWALGALAGGAGDAPQGSAPGDPRLWEWFLRLERCALPLRTAIDGAAGPPSLAPPVRAVLDRRATVELQRALSAAGHLQRLGPQLRARGWPAVVLKGGVPLAEGAVLLDVADLDLLVPRELAGAVAGFIGEGAGWAAGHADPWAGETGAWEMGARYTEGAVQIEVHFDLPFLDEVRPWEGLAPTRVPGVSRLPPPDHLWHVLVHGTVHHPDRRGALRDLVLTRLAVGACTGPEVDVVRRRIRGHAAAGALQSALSMSEALHRGELPPDHFRGVAATRYALAARPRSRLLPPWLHVDSSMVAVAYATGEYRRLWIGSRSSALVSPRHRGSRWVDRYSAPVAWPLRLGWRTVRLAVASLAALPVRRLARRGEGQGPPP